MTSFGGGAMSSIQSSAVAALLVTLYESEGKRTEDKEEDPLWGLWGYERMWRVVGSRWPSFRPKVLMGSSLVTLKGKGTSWGR